MRNNDQTDYYLTQTLTGHGCFVHYTKRICKRKLDQCRCCSDTDTAEHTLFYCRKWNTNISELEIKFVWNITANHAMGNNRYNIYNDTDRKRWMVRARYIYKTTTCQKQYEKAVPGSTGPDKEVVLMVEPCYLHSELGEYHTPTLLLGGARKCNFSLKKKVFGD